MFLCVCVCVCVKRKKEFMMRLVNAILEAKTSHDMSSVN